MIPISMPVTGVEESNAVRDVLSSGILAQGPKVKEFEDVFSRYVGTRYGVAASSGTTALHLALMGCGIGAGDEVVTTPFSFVATANSVLYCGGKVVFADIDPRTYNVDSDSIEERITDKTKAVLIVHLYGQPCDMDAIVGLCREHDISLIEDACQAHGAAYKGKKVGSFGDCGVFSFYPTKNMTTGEGGMITTDDRAIAERTRMLREHGSKERYRHEMLGYNYRMTDLAAAIGIVQLKKLDGFNSKRKKNAARLDETIAQLKGLTPPYVSEEVSHAFNQYTVRVTRKWDMSRDKTASALKEKGIGTGIYYPTPIHKQPYYKGPNDALKVSEEASKEVLSLPVHPGLSADELEYICNTLSGL